MAKKEKEAAPTEAASAEGAEGEAAPKKGKKKILIIAVVAVLAIVGGVLGSGVLGGGKKPAVDEHGEPIEAAPEDAHGGGDAHGDGHGGEKGAAGHAASSKPVYYELPEFLVNLNPQGSSSRVSFLKMTVTLELRDAEAVATMDANKPRVQDVFNTYLRELRPSDIQGSAGIYRLRTDLASRLNSSLEEGLVKDILFSEIIIQ